MGEAKVILTAEDRASGIIDHVTKKLGLFNKEGLAVGVSFAIANKAIELAQRGIQMFTDTVMDGIRRSMDLDLSLTRLSFTASNLGISMGEVKDELNEMSSRFGVDVELLVVGLQSFMREGDNVTDSLKLLGDAEKYAYVSGEDLISIQRAMSETMDVFGLKARDSTYIIEKLNEMNLLTGFTIDDLTQFLGRAAPAIDAYGLNLEQVTDIIYTLEKHGVGAKNLIAEFNKMIEGTSQYKLEFLPDDTVVDIETQFGEIDETATKYFDKWTQDIKGRAGQVGDALGWIAGKLHDVEDWFNNTTVYGDGKPNITATTTTTTTAAPNTDWMDEYITKMDKLRSTIWQANTAIQSLNKEISKLAQDRDRIQEQIAYTIETRSATLEIQRQEDAIESLRRVSNAYNLQQQENSLKIMQIQYGAMGSRRGLGRRGMQQINEIERENMGLQIKEREQQIAIQRIQQGGWQNAQDRMDSIRREHDALMYSQQITDLRSNLDVVVAAWADAVTRINKEISRLDIARFTLGQVQFNANLANAPTTIADLVGRGMSQRVFNALGFPNARVR